MVGWFMRELAVDPISGQRWIRHWPGGRGRGYAEASARLVSAVDLLMAEIEYLPMDEKAKPKTRAGRKAEPVEEPA